MKRRLFALLRFLLSLVVIAMASALATFAAHNLHSTLRFDLVFRPLTAILLLLGFLMLAKGVDRSEERPLEALKFSLRPGWGRELTVGLGLGALLVALCAAAIAIGGTLRMSFHLSAHSLTVAAAVVFVLIMGALAEELMFRGYPFQRLAEAIGPVAAVVLLSALFGCTHLLNPHVSRWAVADTALVGVLFSLAYLRTGRLWMAWGIHFAWNAVLGLVFGLPVSGLMEFAVLARSEASGPQWLTGGSYGIEASATGAVAILIGIAIMVRATRRTGPLAPRPFPRSMDEESQPERLD